MLAAAAVFAEQGLEQGLERDWCDSHAPGALGVSDSGCLLPSKTPQEAAGMKTLNMSDFRGCLASPCASSLHQGFLQVPWA